MVVRRELRAAALGSADVMAARLVELVSCESPSGAVEANKRRATGNW